MQTYHKPSLALCMVKMALQTCAVITLPAALLIHVRRRSWPNACARRGDDALIDGGRPFCKFGWALPFQLDEKLRALITCAGIA